MKPDCKDCRACGEFKYLEDFWRDSKGANGVRANCAECSRSIEKVQRRGLRNDVYWRYNRSPEGVLREAWRALKRRKKQGSLGQLTFYMWAYERSAYLHYYEAWAKNKFSLDYRPLLRLRDSTTTSTVISGLYWTNRMEEAQAGGR